MNTESSEATFDPEVRFTIVDDDQSVPVPAILGATALHATGQSPADMRLPTLIGVLIEAKDLGLDYLADWVKPELIRRLRSLGAVAVIHGGHVVTLAPGQGFAKQVVLCRAVVSAVRADDVLRATADAGANHE